MENFLMTFIFSKNKVNNEIKNGMKGQNSDCAPRQFSFDFLLLMVLHLSKYVINVLHQ